MFRRLFQAWNELIESIHDLRDEVRQARDRVRRLHGLDEPDIEARPAEDDGAAAVASRGRKAGRS